MIFKSLRMMAAACALCLVVGSCQFGHGGDEGFLRLEREAETTLLGGDDGPACKVRIDADLLADTAQAARAINCTVAQAAFGFSTPTPEAAADSFCQAYVRRYKQMLTPLYEADLAYGVAPAWYDYRYSINVRHVAGREGLLCFRIEESRFEGGMREHRSVRCLNFCRATGDAVALDDLCQPVYRAQLPPLLLEAILDAFGCDDLDALHERGVLRLTGAYVPANYLLAEKAVTFIYNAGEIAPFETGAVEVDIPYSAMEPFLKKSK